MVGLVSHLRQLIRLIRIQKDEVATCKTSINVLLKRKDDAQDLTSNVATLLQIVQAHLRARPHTVELRPRSPACSHGP
jgi:hypothetical protein